MALLCVTCGQPIEAGDYRLVGVEKGSWASLYAHRGTCEAEARERHAPPQPATARAKPLPLVEELTEEPTLLPDEGVPWLGMERRR